MYVKPIENWYKLDTYIICSVETFVKNLKSRNKRVLYTNRSACVNKLGLIDWVDDSVLWKVSIPFSMVKGYTQTHTHSHEYTRKCTKCTQTHTHWRTHFYASCYCSKNERERKNSLTISRVICWLARPPKREPRSENAWPAIHSFLLPLVQAESCIGLGQFMVGSCLLNKLPANDRQE